MQRLVIACAQMAVRPMAVAENIDKAVAFAELAVVETGAQVVVFPETITTGFAPDCGVRELWSLIEPIPGPLSEKVSKVAKQLKVYLAYPVYERGVVEGVIYNSLALFGPQGDMLGLYRKTHLFPTERLSGGGWSTPGADPVVVHTPICSFGLTLCYDGDFPELYRCEAVAGAEVILRPSAFLRSFHIWELTNRARAYDNHVYIAACNAVGQDAGHNNFFGHSMIVSPIAQVLSLGRGSEEIIAAELDPDPIKRVTFGSPSPMIFDHLQDRNLGAYRNILTPAQSRFEPARRIPQQG